MHVYSKLTEDDLNSIIEEVDGDGSGTLDFDGNILINQSLNQLINTWTNWLKQKPKWLIHKPLDYYINQLIDT